VQTTKTSVIGAINMLGLAKRLKLKILQASTSEIYGDPSVHPQTETYWGNVNPIGPRSCYDEGKRCAETLFLITGANIGCKSRSPASSILTDHALTPMTGAWSRVSRRPDISEAQRLLGWRPAISLKEGLTKTIPYFEELLAREGVAEAVRL
jgi:nucleoside-diphosphate-sugar epimerase